MLRPNAPSEAFLMADRNSAFMVSRIFRVFDEKFPQVFGTPNVDTGPPLVNE